VRVAWFCLRGAAAAAGSGYSRLGLARASVAGQAGPRLAGPAGWLRRLGQGAGGAGWAEAKGEQTGRRGGARPGWLLRQLGQGKGDGGLGGIKGKGFFLLLFQGI